MPCRILYVSAVSAVGGAERSLVELVGALDRSRFEPVAAIPGRGRLERLVVSAGAEVFRVPAVRFRRTRRPLRLAATGARCLAAAAALARQARRRRIAIVHSNSTTAHLVGAPAAAMAHLPCIWHVRDLHRLGALRRVLAPLTHGAVFVSDAVRQAAGLPDTAHLASVTIPNGIDADAFERGAQSGALRGELALAQDAPLLLMVAHMVPWKGHETFIRAAALLKRDRPDLAAVIAGEDLHGEHGDYVRSLHELVRELALEGAVRFLGRRDDVASLMADCDVVVVPSRAEPFGRVALEAMAVGRPVVGTHGGGLGEVIADGETGLLVPQDDAPATAQAVERFLADGALRARMSEAGRRRVREGFSIAEHARRIAALYEQVMHARRVSLA